MSSPADSIEEVNAAAIATATARDGGIVSERIREPESDEIREPEKAKFDLNVALQALANDSPQMQAQLEKEDNELALKRQDIIVHSRKNFILERELAELDDKIKLLIKNRITLQEVMSSASNFESDTAAKEAHPLHGKRALYEDLFYLLQSKTQYFAKIARLVSSAQVNQFVQTVVFDMYGDQYDTREERLLLDLFRRVIRAELQASSSMGSLFRNNNAITQMLSAYAKRGQGLTILRDILEAPLKELQSLKDLNLEIDPSKVLLQLITDYETKTGKKSDLPRDLDQMQAAENKEVKAVIDQRIKDIERFADMFLSRIIAAVESIPYGMRWICKQLGVLFKERFPQADRYQTGSLMGGYVYLRFFNPAIVAPDAMNLLSTKPSKQLRRNLTLIAKSLQNLSNAQLFGHKEFFMVPLNSFLKRNLDKLQDYFDKLTAVDDLSDALQLDKYLEHTNVRMNSINISFNQIFLIQRLLQAHLDEVAPDPSDPIRRLLTDLGPAPRDLSKAENRVISLQLLDRRKIRLSTTVESSPSPQINQLYFQAKTLLLSVLRLLPSKAEEANLQAFLEAQKRKALEEKDDSLADHIKNVISMLHMLADMGLLHQMQQSSSKDETFNNFLWEIAEEAVDRSRRTNTIQKRLQLVNNALKSITSHHSYLLQRLELYKIYLENARKGGSQQEALAQKDDKKKKEKPKRIKLGHTELEDLGIIESVHPKVERSLMKKCYYVFENVAPGRFEISVFMKRGIDISLAAPIKIVLEELLSMQERNERTLDLESVTLNVNLLVHFLNTKFLSQS